MLRWQLKSLKQRFVEKCLELSTSDKLTVSLAFESWFSKVLVAHMIFSSRFKYCLFWVIFSHTLWIFFSFHTQLWTIFAGAHQGNKLLISVVILSTKLVFLDLNQLFSHVIRYKIYFTQCTIIYFTKIVKDACAFWMFKKFVLLKHHLVFFCHF